MKNEKRKRGFLKENYSLSWNYIKESKNYILIIILLILFGAFTAMIYQPPELIELIKEKILFITQETEGLGPFGMIIYILNNNLRSSFFAMLFGIILGFMPVLSAITNGYFLGFVAGASVLEYGPIILWRLAPHGIFEFPAIILALATGTKLGMFLFKKEKKKELIRRLEGSMRVFLFIILPLFTIAAVIEGLLIILIT